MITRRSLLLSVPAMVAVPRSVSALAEEPTPEQRKLANRLELWDGYARRTRNLMARVSTTRETSLLEEPLLSTGTLLFRAPELLVLRDDGRQGSTTLIDGSSIRLYLNGEGPRAASAIDADERPGARWLAQRLVRLFAPGDGTALLEDTRTHVPKGAGYKLELMPPRGSTARRSIRSITVHLDPVAGAITRIVIAEAQGDRVQLALSDLRQNLPDEDLDAFLDQLER